MRDWVILLILLVLGFLLGSVQTSARAKGQPDFIKRTVDGSVEGFSYTLTHVANSVSDFFGGIAGSPSLRAENRRLRDRLNALNLYVERADLQDQQIQSLRKLIDLPNLPGKTKIPADVVGFFPNDNSFAVSAGLKQGVHAGLPVICAKGLVGIVQTCDANKSQVLLLNSPNVQISALVANKKPPLVGLLRGEGSMTYAMNFMDPKAGVLINDVVTTAGFSDKIPAGIPIGRVLQVENSVEYGTRRAIIFPYVALGEVREVFILK